jgi:hypothetical protein
MALYDSLFTMMDMQAAQLLVTASDFEHDGGWPHPGAEPCGCRDLQAVVQLVPLGVSTSSHC